jgi:peptidoglycan/LPS O-acetylase OafA/YrhL
MTYYQENQFWFWTYLQNWTLVFNEEGQGIALNHFWSLAVEEQYYLVWPLLIFFIKKPKPLLVCCLSLLVLVIVVRIIIWDHQDQFPSYERLFLFTRIDGIIIGSLLAIIHFMNPQFVRRYFTVLIVSLVVLNYSFYFLNRTYDYIFPSWAIAGFTTFAAIFAFAIYEAVMKENRFINYVFTFSLFRFLGRYSYGFYIFHFPVYLMVRPYSDKLASSFFNSGSIYSLIISSIIATLAGLLVSIISFHAFEKRFLKLKKYFE